MTPEARILCLTMLTLSFVFFMGGYVASEVTNVRLPLPEEDDMVPSREYSRR